MNIYLISDTHFGHANIIKYCNRPFKDVSEMNEVIFRNWNSVVSDDDIVYYLGDVGFFNYDKEGISNLIIGLKGKKYLIKGNHDRQSNSFYRDLGFEDVFSGRINLNRYCVLSHYPLNYFSLINSDTRKLYIHGHIHDSHELNYTRYGLQHINVSVEATKYSPVLFNSDLWRIRRDG